MKLKKFIPELSDRLRQTPERTNQLFELFIADMTQELQDDKSIHIQDFGVFEVKKKAERISVNPTTHQRMLVPPKLVLSFKPHNKLKEKFK